MHSANRLRIAAAGILVLGAASASHIYSPPPVATGPDPAQIRALAERLRESAPVTAELPLEADLTVSTPVRKPADSTAGRQRRDLSPPAAPALPKPEPA